MQQIRTAIFESNSAIEPRVAILVSLAHAAGLLDNIFGKAALKERKQRLEKIANGHLVNQATQEALQEFQTLLLVSSIIPATTITVIT